MLEPNRDNLIETIKSALMAKDLQSVDAMFQTFEEIARLWGGDFTVAEANDFDYETTMVELYRNEPNSVLFYLSLSQEGWSLEADDSITTDLETMSTLLATLVYA